MSFYRDQMRIVLTCRTGDWLMRQGWPRLEALTVLLVASFAAFACWSSLADAGLQKQGFRIPLSCIAAYAAYLAAIALWIQRVSPVSAKSLLLDGMAGPIATQRPDQTTIDQATDFASDSFDHALDSQEPEGVLWICGTAAILGVLFVLAFFIYHAPYYLGQLLVDGGKIRHRSLPAGTPPSAIALPFLQSWPVALVLFVHYSMIGFALDALL